MFGDIGPGQAYFDTSVFSAPAQNTWGNMNRNDSIDGPGFWNLDLSLVKRFRFGQRVSFELRADAFNALNHAELRQPERAIRAGDVRAGDGDERLVHAPARPPGRARYLLML